MITGEFNHKGELVFEKETQFLTPHGSPRNRVSVVDIKVNCGVKKETRFLKPGAIAVK